MKHKHSLKEYLSIKEACEYLGISKTTLYKYFQLGLPKSHVLGTRKRQVTITDITAFMNQYRED